MVSEFLSEEFGQLKLNEQQHQANPFIPKETCVYLQLGKDREGFWTSEHLVEQVKTKAIPIFETLFPTALHYLHLTIVQTMQHLNLMLL